ncbi:lactoylglutathione lyase [Pedobacter sp. UYEF25]
MKTYISKFLLLFSLSGIMFKTNAQDAVRANHVALYVNNLAKSAAFYKDVMKLQEIPEPFHDGKHVWLKTGPNTNLHLIQGAEKVTEHDINSHFAYSVGNMDNFIKHLDALHIEYGNWKQQSKTPQIRPDGVKQIYLKDPDNIWIEVNDEKL